MLTIKNFSFQITRLMVALAFVASVPAVFAAATWTQNLQQDCQMNATSQACAGIPSVTVSGWTTGTGSKASPTTGTTFAAATVYNWGTGLGVVSGNENSSATGPHAIDNGYGIEALMLNFTSGPVNLSSLAIGWNGTDNPCISANNGTGSCASSATGGGSITTIRISPYWLGLVLRAQSLRWQVLVCFPLVGAWLVTTLT